MTMQLEARRPAAPTNSNPLFGALVTSGQRGRRRHSIISGLPMRCASLLAAVIVLGIGPTVLLAGDCVGQPNLQPAPEGHWYYRVDFPSRRKCWYLMRQQPSSEPSAEESASTATTLTSLFASLSAAWQGATPARLEATPAQSADPIALKKNTSRSHEARRRVLNAKRAARLSQLSTASRLKHADQQDQLDAAQREALFEEYLRWATQH
jgi:hypothetical protein